MLAGVRGTLRGSLPGGDLGTARLVVYHAWTRITTLECRFLEVPDRSGAQPRERCSFDRMFPN